ncbi:hypothetical protein CTAYLR_000312 [Chrysophaeum taylorii]|uniref:Prokaryotic-type class I peptide chain release factors domain-containing protein n=1 Tax=Chrysophaeum taylorii TaxID=2483200 RepID=A0AAD7UEJ4_9STRA|nr:hypothetical protein CTAYLR_000312 [Chrysophaeum taylorii]
MRTIAILSVLVACVLAIHAFLALHQPSPPDHFVVPRQNATVRRRPAEEETAKTKKNKNTVARVHVVFSTDCSRFMQWQALTLMDSAARAGQRGVVTRLVSGCDEARAQLSRSEVELSRARRGYPFATRLHFTPDFNGRFLQNSSQRFRFANKPFAIRHWLRHLGEPPDDDVLAVLVDPDFVFLRPLDLWALTGQQRGDRWDDATTVRATRGKPAAHYYGLGAAWLRFHLDRICGTGSPCLRVTHRDVSRHYNAGPPYVLHWHDLRALAEVWVDFTPKFWDDYPLIDGPNRDPTRHYAEMYAYVAAAAHLGLPHRLLKDLMVGCMVGWAVVDASTDDDLQQHPCGTPRAGPAPAGPALVHYCQRYVVGAWKFGKRAVPDDVLLVARTPSPPRDLFVNATRYHGGGGGGGGGSARGGGKTPAEARRHAFVVCAVHAAINGARRRRLLLVLGINTNGPGKGYGSRRRHDDAVVVAGVASAAMVDDEPEFLGGGRGARRGDAAPARRTARELSELDMVLALREQREATAREAVDLEAMAADEADADLRAEARRELAEIEPRLAAIEEELVTALLPAEEGDAAPGALLEIRAAAGGDEATAFAREMATMYERYAATREWRWDLVAASKSEFGGLRDAIAVVTGDRAYLDLKWESGVHRVQRVPANDDRVHTSTVTVVVLPNEEDTRKDGRAAELPIADLKIETMRSSGAGGQHVNTTDSAVRVTHLPTGLVVSIQDERSQHMNRTKALRVLAARVHAQKAAAKQAERNQQRAALAGSGERSERVRTYNIPHDRVTDHRVNHTANSVLRVLSGELLDDFVSRLVLFDRDLKLRAASSFEVPDSSSTTRRPTTTTTTTTTNGVGS